jgi:transcriptional regulator GlxA family with amidase domain
VAAERAFGREAEGDALSVVAGFSHERYTGRPLRAALRAAARRFRALGGVESGGWLLARAGLLDGRAAPIHWED